MADETISLGTRRALGAQDSLKWTPLDLLREVLRRIEAGEIAPDQLAVCWRESAGMDEPGRWGFFQAGMTDLELLGLLEATKANVSTVFHG